MMKKSFLKLIALVLACLCTVGTYAPAASAAAAPGTAEPLYTGFGNVAISFSISTTGKANCVSYVSGHSGYSIDLTMTLQKSSNGKTWSNVKSWSTSGSGSILLDKTRSVSSGYTYRVKASVKAYNSSGKTVCTTTEYSSTKSY